MPVDSEKYIYHFTRSATALIYILPNLSLKLSNYLNSNDPKENKTFGFWSIFENCNDSNIKQIRSSLEHFMRINCKHLCFSMDYKDQKSDIWINGFDHPAMWAHYGENSKGICLALHKETFLRENPNLISKKVKYKTFFRFPQINENEWAIKKDDYLKEFLTKNFKHIFFRKHKHWGVEHEFKVIEIGQKDYCTIKNSLRVIYLGPDFDRDQLAILKQIVSKLEQKTHKIFIEEVKISEGRFWSHSLISTPRH